MSVPARLTGLLILLFSNISQAEFYSCSFPGSSLELYASDNLLSVSSELSGSQSFKISNKVLVHGLLTVSLKEAPIAFVIDRRVFPYQVSFGGHKGFCDEYEGEHAGLKYELWSTKSAVTSVVHAWPGEFVEYQGYEVNEDMSLAPGEAWKSLKKLLRSEKACTIKKGKLIVPISARKHEQYVSLWKPQANILSFIAAGQCLYERDGKSYMADCPYEYLYGEQEDSEFEAAISDGQIPLGYHVKLQCDEGHWAWITEETLMKKEQEAVLSYVDLYNYTK